MLRAFEQGFTRSGYVNSFESILIVVLERMAFSVVSLNGVNRGIVFHQSLTGLFIYCITKFLGVANKFSRFAEKASCNPGKPGYKV